MDKKQAFRELRYREMQRDIRFRAWNPNYRGGHMSECGTTVSGKPHWPDIRGGTSYADESILMQFTGVKDKTDREIWQDDLIQDSSGLICMVKWHKCLAGWDAWDDVAMKFMGQKGNFKPNNWPDAVVVIGNIYEGIEK